MKIIEESKLKSTILQLNQYEKDHNSQLMFFDSLDNVMLPSLQSASYESDLAFFGEISFILSVINSIISHPHLSNKGEDIVIRSDQAGHISSESFQKVFKEPDLWKEKDKEMVPEYVHHYQYTDDLKIYENLFIGLVIKLIDMELAKYTNFYTNLIPTLDINTTTTFMEADASKKAFDALNIISRKLRYIKNTYFYHEISKVKFSPRNIEPTNILVKDRLYNYCFKFYKKFIQYTDVETLYNDFRKYYWYKILKLLKQEQFKLIEEQTDDLSDLTLSNDDYLIEIKLEESQPTILFKITLKESNVVASHRLMFDVDKELNQSLSEDDRLNTITLADDVLTLDKVSIWELKEVSSGRSYLANPATEDEIVHKYIANKLYTQNMSESIYTIYCPSCKSKNLEEIHSVYTCNNCGTKYTFKKNNLAWFLRIGGINSGRK